MRLPFCTLSAVLLCLAPLAQAQTDVLTQHNDLIRTGTSLHETTLTPVNVSPATFGMLFMRQVDDQLYTQPLIATDIHVRGGVHDLVIVTTVNNSVYAFDANDRRNQQPLWHVNFGTPADLHDANFGCLDINGNMGIIGAPVIDAAKTTIYVVALTRVAGHFEQRLHALDLATGADLPNSPRTIHAPQFDPLFENQRPALALDHGHIYIGYASHCDKRPYHGFLFSYDAQTLQQLAVFNTSPTGDEASIWQSGQAPAIDSAGNVYVITGNGSWNGTTDFSESFLKLSPSLKLLDWFTPTNHFDLDKRDLDLDSSGPTLIPRTQLVLGGGKEGILYSVDANHFGHLGDQHAVQHFRASSSHLHSFVYWHSAQRGDLLYLWGQRDRLQAFALHGEHIEEKPVMAREEMNEGHPGAMVSLSANGDHDGILWAAIHATGDSWHESRPGILHAYVADDLSHELWNSLENPQRDNCFNYSKMAPPTIANGKVYLASFGKENIGTGMFCVYGLLPSGPPPATPQHLAGEIKDHFITLHWDAVPGAETYTITGFRNAQPYVAASGLTKPFFTEPVASKGLVTYTVSAVNANGESQQSDRFELNVQKAPMPRMQH